MVDVLTVNREGLGRQYHRVEGAAVLDLPSLGETYCSLSVDYWHWDAARTYVRRLEKFDAGGGKWPPMLPESGSPKLSLNSTLHLNI